MANELEQSLQVSSLFARDVRNPQALRTAPRYNFSMSSSHLSYRTSPTEPGPFSIVTDSDGLVVAAGFTDDIDRLVARIPEQRSSSPPSITEGDFPAPLGDAVAAYFSGDVRAWEEVAVARDGSKYHQEVWDLLRQTPPGQPVTYTELARRSSNPRAIRAVASACARNPIAPLVPCHRIIRSDGGLGGYAFGLDVKQWLLDHEAAAARR